MLEIFLRVKEENNTWPIYFHFTGEKPMLLGLFILLEVSVYEPSNTWKSLGKVEHTRI